MIKCPIGQHNNYLTCPATFANDNLPRAQEEELYKHLLEIHSNLRIARALAHNVAEQSEAKSAKRRLAEAPPKNEKTSEQKVRDLRNEVLETLARLEQMDVDD